MGKRTKVPKRKLSNRAMVEKCLERAHMEIAGAADKAKTMRRQLKAGDIRAAFQTAIDLEPHLHHGNDVIQAASFFARPIRDD